jgi:hypothetical protein
VFTYLEVCMSKRHRAGRNIRGGVAVGAVLTAAALTTGAAYSSASAAPEVSCSDAINAYNTAVGAEKTTNDAQALAVKNDTDAKAVRDTAIAKAQSDYLAWVAANPNATDAQVKARQELRDKQVADANKAYADGGTVAKLAAASSAEKTASMRMNDAKAAADTACQGPAGPVGPAGVAGAVGPKGIDARIVLSPGVCARAVVTPDPERLVRVVTLIPCPVAVPAPPAVEPRPGDEVVVIPPAAPVPPVQEAHLPVTH